MEDQEVGKEIQYVDEYEYRIEERIYGDNTRKYTPQYRLKSTINYNLPKGATIVSGWIDSLDEESLSYTTLIKAVARIDYLKESRRTEFKSKLIETNYYPA